MRRVPNIDFSLILSDDKIALLYFQVERVPAYSMNSITVSWPLV
ncbi:MAG: hypothetical protein RLZZ630_1593 [Bacteroidota bacterium]|jgi:hypothetical protein